MVRERKIEGYKWLTNESTTIKEEDNEIKLCEPRSDGAIAREYASRFKVPISDIRVVVSLTDPNMRAVYRKITSDKMLG